MTDGTTKRHMTIPVARCLLTTFSGVRGRDPGGCNGDVPMAALLEVGPHPPGLTTTTTGCYHGYHGGGWEAGRLDNLVCECFS